MLETPTVSMLIWNTMSEIIAIIVCSLLLLIGASGVFLPILPGVPLAWLGIFIYALVTGFEAISITTVVVFFVLSAFTLVLDFVAPMLGAKKYRASKFGIFGAFAGALIGIFTLGFWGIIVGPLAGAFAGELVAKGDVPRAFGSAAGSFVGCIAGSLVKIVLIFIMAGFFVASVM